MFDLTNDELIAQFRQIEDEQKSRWLEILSRGLYAKFAGINPEKRDSSWRTPPGCTRPERFFAGVRSAPRHYYGQGRERGGNKPRIPVISADIDLSDMPD
jgi:hypothetical protein